MITLFISVLKVLIKLYRLRVIDFFINIIIYLTNHTLKQAETEFSDQIYELELQLDLYIYIYIYIYIYV